MININLYPVLKKFVLLFIPAADDENKDYYLPIF